jgi:hypothetical protein
MSDIFINSETSRPTRPGPEPTTEFIVPLLLISALIIIYLKIKTKV